MYDKEQELDNVVKAIEENSICFFEDIELYVAPSKRIMQDWGFHELPTIKEQLAKNKVKRKSKMRKKWEDSDNATLQISAYKLMATDEELEKLTVNNNKNQHSGELGITWKEEKTYEANEETNHSD